MKKETILDTPQITMWHYPEDHIIHHQMHTFVFGDTFRGALAQGAAYFKKHKCSKWLSDDRLNATLKKDDMDWASNEWSDQVLQSGWRYWAIVMPDKTVGKMSMKRAIESYKQKDLTIEVFDDDKEALKWLIGQK